MNPYLVVMIIVVLSAIVIVLMMQTANRYIQEKRYIDNENEILQYKYNVLFCFGAILIMIVSAVCGYVISIQAVSVLAVIELVVTYLAIMAAAIMDFKLKIIPNYIPLSLIVVRIIIAVYEMNFMQGATQYLISSFAGLLFCVVFFAISGKLSRGGIGGGDIKLLCAIGFMCGIYVVFSTLLLALLVCIIVNGCLVLFKKQSKKGHIAFAPYIYVGYVVMCLFTLY